MERNHVKTCGTLAEIEQNNPDLLKEWNAVISKDNSYDTQMSPGKTARERWRLFKNITKIGLVRSNIVDEDSFPSIKPTFSSFRKRTSSIRARLFTHDIVLPIDECNDGDVVLRRKGTNRRRNCTSLDIRPVPESNYGTEKPLVVRHVSTPVSLFYNGAHNGSLHRL